MVIAVDIDGTIAQTTRRLVPYLGLKIIYDYNPFSSIQEEGEFFRKNEQIFNELRPYDGAAKVLWLIKRHGWDVVYLTSRSPSVKNITRLWLLKNRFPPGELIFTSDKASVLGQIKAQVFVEDAPKYIEAASDITTILIKDQPYNRHISGRRFKRWHEVLSLLKAAIS